MRTFDEVLKLWDEASERAKQAGKPELARLERNDPELNDYHDKVRSSYSKPWPRPWPCGTVWLHWDSRFVRVNRQLLDISTGIYRLELLHDGQPAHLDCAVNWDTGYISVTGDAPVTSIAYYPHTDSEVPMPEPKLTTGGAGFRCLQRLPATAPTAEVPEPPPSDDDRFFAFHGNTFGEWIAAGPGARFERQQPGDVRVDLALFTSLDDPDPAARANQELEGRALMAASTNSEQTTRGWRDFWSHSAVEFDDAELERVWDHNQYFLACTLKEGKVAPGLFGNWSTGKIGTAWHGDYHMNYNTQQVFWGVFSSNHVSQHLPYVDLVEKLMPMATWNAREQFGLPGAYFPHSAYPVPSNVNPYPVPPWGYEICETPWTVQSLWWHYLYTLDEDFLRRVYPVFRAATDLLVAYAKKGGDGKYHLNPSVSPENWGLTVDHRLNRDIIIDIALTEFLLDAMLEASRVLGRDAGLLAKWSDPRGNLADYPTIDGPHCLVWGDAADAPV
ncbi:MAG: hypothetical protein GY953_22525 [bacterium]|nr:hypothetical protein [bacterium]